MCIILPVDHLTCSHTVAVWHHCQNAPKTRLLGLAPCGRIRQHSRPILTRKLCHNCGGPRVLNFRRPNEIVQIKEEKEVDSRYSTKERSEEKIRRSFEEEMEQRALAKGKARETIYEETEDDEEKNDFLLLRRRDPGFRPHHYKNGHWTPRRGSEYSTSRRGSEHSASIRSKRISQLCRSIYSDTSSEISEFEDAIGKARGSDWPKSPNGTHMFPGPSLLPTARATTPESNVRDADAVRASISSSSSHSSPDSPQTEHPYWDTGPIKPDPASPASSTSNSSSHPGTHYDDSDSTRSSRSSNILILPGADEEEAPTSSSADTLTHHFLQQKGHFKKDSGVETEEENGFDPPSPLEIEQYSVIMATTAMMTRAERISLHAGFPLRTSTANPNVKGLGIVGAGADAGAAAGVTMTAAGAGGGGEASGVCADA